MWKSLSWRSKLQLLQFIGAGLFSELPKVSAADVAQLDDNDAAAAVVKELTTRFPEVQQCCETSQLMLSLEEQNTTEYMLFKAEEGSCL